MPKFLEKKLKKEYPGNPGAVYGTMNKMGYMKGSKETAKGKAAESKHESKESKKVEKKEPKSEDKKKIAVKKFKRLA